MGASTCSLLLDGYSHAHTVPRLRTGCPSPGKKPFDEAAAVQTYVELIKVLPIPNQYLLLYVLDLLSLFEKKSDKNLMTANSASPRLFSSTWDLIRSLRFFLFFSSDQLVCIANETCYRSHPESDLAVIFQPGILSHPDHRMLPPEHALSQTVLEFLVTHVDDFSALLESRLENNPYRKGKVRFVFASYRHGGPQLTICVLVIV